MSFWLQLQLLVWKNLTLRKRHWGRLLVEIIWPLVLFVILVLVRTRGLKKYHHECYFDEKAMPSAGFIPFAQGFLCTFNNTCHRDVREEQPWMVESYNDSFVNRFVSDLESVLYDNFDAGRVEALGRVFEDLQTLRKLSTRIRDQLGNNATTIQGLNVDSVSSLLEDPSAFRADLVEWTEARNISLNAAFTAAILSAQLRPESFTPAEMFEIMADPRSVFCSPEVAEKLFNISGVDREGIKTGLAPLCNLSLSDAREFASLLGTHINWNTVQNEFNEFSEANGQKSLSFEEWRELARVAADLREDLQEKESIKKLMADLSEVMDFDVDFDRDGTLGSNSTFNMTDALKAYAAIYSGICGVNSTGQLFNSGGETNRFDQLRDQFKKKEDGESKYQYDNSTSEECNDIIKGLEESGLINYLWDQIKPFIRGKILYTPDTPATRRIMRSVNETFRPIENLKALARSWIDLYSNRFQTFFLDPDNQQFLEELFTNDQDNILDFILNNNLTSVLRNTTGNAGPRPMDDVDEIRERFKTYFSGNYSDRWNESFTQLDSFVKNVSTYLSCFEVDKFQGVNSEYDLELEGLKLIGENKLWAGVVFVDFRPDQKTDKLPEFIRYKIRMNADKVDSTRFVEDRLSRPGPRRRPGIDLKYLYYGFAYLQDMIDHSIIALQSGRNLSDMPGMTLQQMPYPCYIEDQFILTISRTFPMLMTLAWVYSASMIIKSIVHEKEQRLKETMRVMGLGNFVHWVSWFIDSVGVMFISCILLTVILVHGHILTFSDPFLVFCFMLSYTVATIMLSFFLSTLFSRANVAAAAGGVIFFCLYLPYSFMVVWEEKLSSEAKILSSLVSNIGFGFGCAYFAHYEESGVGAQWDNIWESPLLGDQFSMAGVLGMLWIDSLLYGLLAWYIEAVFPGQYGVPKPWYFFVTRSYWCGKDLSALHAAANDLSEGYEMDMDPKNTIEKEPSHLPLGVSIKHLHKVYSNGKVAVEDLNLNFFEGQITSFLGHNGAGKTTTISILTGLFPPSAGTAKINGLDITKDMDAIRSSLGTCPQHNVLFNSLTVYEHLWFYARIKGVPAETVRREADEMIVDLGLPHKRNELSQNLSGGMQRKLSVACAFVGGSRTVVLDEPTAGVDPYSRRSIWDMLIKYKKDRTIILTTHFMDEADLLGDRIAIINNGKLVCCGSSLYLRQNYGNGYYLTLVRDDGSKASSSDSEVIDESLDAGVNLSSYAPSVSSSVENDLIIDDEGISDVTKHNGIVINPSSANASALTYPLTKFIQRHVMDARLLEQIGSEIIYILPTTEENSMKRFEALFADLDLHINRLGIKSYGLSNTTLEEIFLKVASNGQDGEIVRQNALEESTDGGNIAARFRSRSIDLRASLSERNKLEDDEDDEDDEKTKPVQVEGKTVTYSQVPAFENDAKILTRSKNPVIVPGTRYEGKALVARHIVALQLKRFHHSRRNVKGFLCEIVLPVAFVCMAMIFTMILPPLEEERPLEISPWLYPTKGDMPTTTFYSNSHKDGDWPNRYERNLVSSKGMGARCISPKIYQNLPACQSQAPNITSFFSNITEPENLGQCSCQVGTQTCPADAFGAPIPMIQMPSYDYLLNMTNRNISDWLMKTRDEYYKRRYGGFEFGVRNPLARQNVSKWRDIFHRLSKASNLGDPHLDSTSEDVVFGNVADFVSSTAMFDNIRVWFNNKGWAASVAYMNAINNVVLRSSVEQSEEVGTDGDFFNDVIKDPNNYGIAVINHPMNFTKEQLDTEILRQIGASLLHAICIIFAMSFVPASFVVFHIEERTHKVKHLQFVSGIKPTTYWIAALLWDMTMYLISAMLCVFVILAFDAEAYVSADNFPGLLIIMFMYGFAAIPLMYPASFLFSIPSSAFVTLGCLNLFFGIITTVTTSVLENFGDQELKDIGLILKDVFLIFPHYCLGRGLMDMATEENLNKVIGRFGLVSVRNRFAWDFLGKFFFCLLVEGIAFFALTLALEYKVWTRLRCTTPKRNEIDDTKDGSKDEDEDVTAERNRVLAGGAANSTDVLEIRDIYKTYSKKANPAVDHLTFGVRKGECFGLLGVNGAGKTTTFKMITGDTYPTSGDGFVNGFSILSEMQAVRRNIGYCPQFDALNALLTGREHLQLYARLRGLPEAEAKKVTEWGLKKLGLIAYANRKAGTYSGGNKRKLSTAIALIGNPSIVFLDEPTSGMDPGARRFLWNCILEIIRGGQSVVLTSHSMEECEALCSRMGIMVNGRFQCLGSGQHLKSRFGSGYTLTVRCDGQRESLEGMKRLVHTAFPMAELKEEHYNQLQYQLPIKQTKLTTIFKEMEKAKLNEESGLEDYSITQTTLDEVFIRFASRQTEMLEDEAMGAAAVDAIKV